MAKINRDFFIPYINSICATHILKNKLAIRMEEIEEQIEYVQRGQREPTVEKPYYFPEWSEGRIVGVVFLSLIVLLWIFASCAVKNTILWSHIIVLGFFGTIIGLIIKGVREDKTENAYRAEQYNEAQQELKRIREKNARAREIQLPGMWKELKECDNAYAQTDRALQEIYNANIIPGQYRNIHAMIYLYDWFSKSAEDDLGMALNTFVLEQIKDRLDEIIYNQGEMILNQQLQLSMQMQSMEEKERHQRALEQKLDRLQLTEEERNWNMEMIARTNSSLAWYAQQDYIRNII